MKHGLLDITQEISRRGGNLENLIMKKGKRIGNVSFLLTNSTPKTLKNH